MKSGGKRGTPSELTEKLRSLLVSHKRLALEWSQITAMKNKFLGVALRVIVNDIKSL